MKGLCILLFSFFLFVSCGSSGPDLIIRNGRIVNGTGAPAMVQDIAITDGVITDVRVNLTVTGKREIDAEGLIVAPGFIDVHSHSDRGILQDLSHHNMIRQGVTTSIMGNCGESPVDVDAFFAALDTDPPTTNSALLIGHNAVRRSVMGDEERAPESVEIEKMSSRIAAAMEEGVLGMSTGLITTPGIYADTDEITGLADIVAQYSGKYVSHIRGEAATLWEAIDEAIEIGRRAQLSVQVSHAKIAADSYWGQTGKYMHKLQKARDEGMVVYADQYPYRAGSGGLISQLPDWCRDGGREALLQRLQDPETRERIVRDTIKRWKEAATTFNRAESIRLVQFNRQPEFNGKSLTEICELLDRTPTLENGIRLALELLEQEACRMVGFYGNEEDVVSFMQNPYVMVGSDGACVIFGEGVPHPRYYGTYPRILGRYVREQGVLTLEEAIRKMTSLPAKAFGIEGRGVLREGAFADIVIFNPETILDKASFQKPHQYPEGIPYVIVNGEIVVEENRITDRRPGRVLRGPGYMKTS